jgi:hypothetical protein
MQLNVFTYNNEELNCQNCKWQGKGKELIVETESEQHSIFDLSCPKCGEHMGFIQAPLKKEIEEWKKKNPDWKPDKN